ncbi:MAG: hypothetical protein JWQ21_4084 [Herminiimonas sp.]|nr:hypothetical protein [Herminiimonas sp.]
MARIVRIGIGAFLGLFYGNAFPFVFGDAGASRDLAGGKYASTVN